LLQQGAAATRPNLNGFNRFFRQGVAQSKSKWQDQFGLKNPHLFLP
jgi:hypothetical protein